VLAVKAINTMIVLTALNIRLIYVTVIVIMLQQNHMKNQKNTENPFKLL
jgi:hypothetical protein